MQNKMKARLQAAKGYAETHVPHIVTAVASVTGVVLLSALVKDTKATNKVHRTHYKLLDHQAQEAGMLVQEGYFFDLYPGVGTRIYPKDDNYEV